MTGARRGSGASRFRAADTGTGCRRAISRAARARYRVRGWGCG